MTSLRPYQHAPSLRVLSLGAGLQSSAMALMTLHQLIAPPDCAIFADTGNEPARVYKHLEWLKTVVPFPVYVVSNRDITADVLRSVEHKVGKRAATPPFWTIGKDGRATLLSRQCTSAYKVEPINRKIRELLGVKPRCRVPAGVYAEVLIGISTDEAHRVKPAPEKWISRAWPLIDLRLNRWDCRMFLTRNGYPVPGKSACMMCPYSSDAAFRDLKDNDPQGWAETVALDEAIRNGMRTTAGPLFVHRSLRPLSEVDLSTADEKGQPDMFGNECEGMCGV